MELSQSNRCLIHIYTMGYRVIEGELFNPKGKKLAKYINKSYVRKRNDIRYTHTFRFKDKWVPLGIHKIVAYQKFGDKLFEKNIQVRHLDGNSLNNLDSNIDIGTPSQNMMDIPKEIRQRMASQATASHRAFTEEEIKQIFEDKKLGLSYLKLCEKYHTSKSTLSYLFNSALYAKKHSELDKR